MSAAALFDGRFLGWSLVIGVVVGIIAVGARRRREAAEPETEFFACDVDNRAVCWRVRVASAVNVPSGIHEGDVELVHAQFAGRFESSLLSLEFPRRWYVALDSEEEARTLELEIWEVIRRHDLYLNVTVEFRRGWRWWPAAPPERRLPPALSEDHPGFEGDEHGVGLTRVIGSPIHVQNAAAGWEDARCEVVLELPADEVLPIAERLSAGGTAYGVQASRLHIPAEDEEAAHLIVRELDDELNYVRAIRIQTAKRPLL